MTLFAEHRLRTKIASPWATAVYRCKDKMASVTAAVIFFQKKKKKKKALIDVKLSASAYDYPLKTLYC